MAADQTRVKLNSLLNHSRHALLDGIIRETYRERINASEEYFNWTGVLSEQIFVDFFTHFAGQGRVRWHYGVAHPLLCSFENSFLAERGRGWLDDADSARTAMREHHRPDQHGLLWFDPRMVRQIASSICIVGGSTGSAFILSYYTPTVSLRQPIIPYLEEPGSLKIGFGRPNYLRRRFRYLKSIRKE